MEDFAALGFLAADVEAALKTPAPIEVQEIDTQPVEDTFWLAVRGPLKEQHHALQRLRELMADLPGVEVDIGTTAG